VPQAVEAAHRSDASAETELNVIAPADASTVRAERVLVRGTVVPADASVQIMGRPIKVTNGLFRANTPLQMGSNSIDVVAVANGSNPVTTTVLVNRGRTAAQLAATARKKREARAAAARKAKRVRAERRKAKAERESTSTSAGASGCVEVPNVVGKDHQSAQNAMQAAGLYMLDEEDASGQGRMLLWDRNWVDVAQKPAAGECVSPDTGVLLTAKKIGE
jgi:hypothetical protein